MPHEDVRTFNRPSHGPILMLVPHEPDEDPRIKWVIELCAQFGRTDVIGYADAIGDRPARSYDGIIFVDRANPSDYLLGERYSILWRLFRLLLWRFPRFLFLRLPGLIYRLSPHPRMTTPRQWITGETPALRTRASGKNWKPQSQSWVSSFHHFVVIMQFLHVISNTLYRRARSSSLRPSLIICHDLHALLAGVKLKKLFGCPVLYDSHELWPEAFLEAKKWEGKLIALLEQRAIRHADAVITVTPQIARYLEHSYKISDVQTVPNAEPFQNHLIPSCHRPLSRPLKFILQGRVVSGRGTEELMDAWRRLRNQHAILIIRARDNMYYAQLREKYSTEIEKGLIVIASPVSESELVEAAAVADVGIIPYRGPNLCHIYSCPNKLSQYMQAGLAILCNADLEFVSNIVRQQECGLSYQAGSPETLLETVQSLVNNPERLQSMKNRAYSYAASEFNWEKQSIQYKEVIRELSNGGKAFCG